MPSYSACFATIMLNITFVDLLAEIARRDGLSFIVESEHRNNGELEKWFHHHCKAHPYAGIEGAISFAGKANCRALQIADFMAFYSRRFGANSDRFDGNLLVPSEKLYRP